MENDCGMCRILFGLLSLILMYDSNQIQGGEVLNEELT
jgi:hypothetical protein